MIKNLLKFFFDDYQESLTFYKLYSKLLTWNKQHRLPHRSDLPLKITLSDDFWKHVVQLHKDTTYDGLERAFSVVWIEDDLAVSGVIKGSSTQVEIKSTIQVKYEPTYRQEYFKKNIYIDSKLYSSSTHHYKLIPKSIDIRYLFNMHTHPPHITDFGTSYGTFSAQDIKSLCSSTNIITGLITDRIYLLFKTTKSIKNADHLKDSDITLQLLNDKYGFVIYEGQFNSTLNRLFPDLVTDDQEIDHYNYEG